MWPKHSPLGIPYHPAKETRVQIIDSMSKTGVPDHATHQKGGDQFVKPPPWANKGKWINSHGVRVRVGAGYSDAFLRWVFATMKAERNSFFGIVGPPGIGKTYAALRIAQMIDPDFKIRDVPAPNPSEDNSQLVFSREHLLHLLGESSPLERGSVIIIDEPQYSLSSRRWFETLQQDLVQALEGIRHRGFVILLVVLHLSMIDNHIRDHVLSMQIEMRNRGVGVAKERYMPQWDDKVHTKTISTLELLLPSHWECSAKSCLTCTYLTKGCLNIRAVYERRKREYLFAQTADAQARHSEKKNAKAELKLKVNSDAIYDKLLEHKGELLWNRSGNLEATFVTLFVQREFNVSLGQSKSAQISKGFALLHPELKPI